MYKSKQIHITIIMLIVMLTQINTIKAQTIDQQLSDKYWNYREKLVNDYMIGIGPDYGYSLPANKRKVDNGGQIDWGDQTIHLGHYIGILATEYEILTREGKSTNRTIEELFWALSAFNRLDYYAETYYQDSQGNNGSHDLNGFFIRDDVHSIPNYDYLNTDHNPNIQDVSKYDCSFKNSQPMSKDQVIFMLMGLELARKYIPANTYYFACNGNTPLTFNYETPANSDILQEVINIENRILLYISSNKGYMTLNAALVMDFPELDTTYLNSEPSVYGWYIKNPVTGQNVTLGYNAFTQSKAFDKLYENINNGSHILSSNVIYQITGPLGTIIYRENQVSYKMASLTINWPISDYIMSYKQGHLFLTLGITSGIYNQGLLPKFMGEEFCFNQAYWSYGANYDWLVLLQANLFPSYIGTYYQNKEAYFKTLLEKAPIEGPSNIKRLLASYEYEWSSDRRTTNPESRGNINDSGANFSGIGYMLIYNLYNIYYNKSNYYGDYRISLRTDNILRSTNTHYSLGGTVHNAFNKSYEENCNISNGFYINSPKTLPINSVCGSVINSGPSLFEFNFNKNVEGSSPTYMKIINNGDFIIGDFNKNSSVNMSGIVNINDGAVLHFDAGSSLELYESSEIIVKEGGTLVFKSGSEIKLFENSKITVQPGGHLCFENNVDIYLENTNNTIEYIYGSDYCYKYSNLNSVTAVDPNLITTTGNGQLIVPCGIFECSEDISPTGVVHWNNVDYNFTYDIFLASGTELTISNSTINFSKSKGITIAPEAKLILDNTEINVDCEDYYWKGILVQGDENYDQSDETKQGVLEMKNGATIENAEVAVYVGKYFIDNSQSPLPSNYGNGKIKISNSNFINNQRDIVMRPNAISLIGGNSNTLVFNSFVLHTIFKNDANIPTDDVLNKGKMGNIYLNGISNLRIQGNTFENLDNTLAAIDKGRGIIATNSSINVSPYCDPQITPCSILAKNRFINLYYGINVINGALSSNNIIKIQDNEFTNTYRAIFLSGTNNAEVLSNDIQASNIVAVQSGQPDPGTPYGIYLNGGKGFRVEENTIYRPTANGAATFNGSRGIIVHKTGAVNNEIYKNTLTNLFLGDQAQCYNSGTDLPPWTGSNNPGAATGLKFFCNTSQTDAGSYDMWMGGVGYCTPNTSTLIGAQRFGIAKFQKNMLLNPSSNQYEDAPAGNKFSDSHLSLPTTATVDFDNGQAGWLEYSWDDLDGNGPDGWKPIRKDNLTNQQIQVTFDVCPSKISTGGNGTTSTQLYANLNTAQIALNSSITLLNIWQDGGNANLDQVVETTQPWDVYQQFNSLLAESPYLSDEVLIEVIQNPAFTSLMVKLLMIANPHAVNSDAVMYELENRLPAMPQTYIDEIKSQPETSSQLQVLQGNVATDNHLVSIISEDIKRMYRSDNTNTWAKDSLIAFMSRKPGLYDKYELATIYLSYGQYTDMDNVLTDIDNNFELVEELQTDYTNFVSLMTIAQNMQENTLYEEGLSEAQRTSLETILTNDRPNNAPLALALLKRDNPDYVYSEVVYDVPQNSPRLAAPKHNAATVVVNPDFKLYPNPALDYTTLSYNCRYNNLSYTVIDISGREIKTSVLKTIEDVNYNEVLINLGGISPGTYYFVVKANNTSLYTEKLVIAK